VIWASYIRRWWRKERAMDEKMGATIVSALGMQGLDMRKPYLFDFYFYVPDEARAQQLADELRC
jgi:hypothetical protein